MIFVRRQPEPPSFQSSVRQPGLAFLARVQNPRGADFKKQRHWKHCLSDLHAAYGGICAYSAHWIPPDVSRGTVDHYLPRDSAPELAYEWSNFRLCTEKMNNYKDCELDVMDPFHIQNGWFVINFTSFFIEAADTLPDYLKVAAKATITRLRFNIDNALMKERFNWVKLYANGDVSFDFLLRRYPFIACELERQNLKDDIKTRFRGPRI
ncbi:MAG: hypothetical protein H7Z16_12030 [Pyrinomonadaceae bacterium]|nr:hypothetical protein [Pyrinomonadaceae bacterium]